MSLTTIHEWEADGKRYRAVYDEMHETRGSYGYDTPEETKAAEDEELSKLASGEWIAIGIIVRKNLKPEHCKTCSCAAPEWRETDALWGIVVENDSKAIERVARECM